jgi:hypothetical protein
LQKFPLGEARLLSSNRFPMDLLLVNQTIVALMSSSVKSPLRKGGFRGIDK